MKKQLNDVVVDLISLLDGFSYNLPDDASNQVDRIDVSYDHLAIEDEKTIRTIVEFLDDWVDASNHNWDYHDPVTETDWPAIARVIAESLKTDGTVSLPQIYIDSR